MKKTTSILVAGAGYVGLATAVYLANQDYNVLTVDTNREIVDCLNKGRLHFHEPGLARQLKKVLKLGRLSVKLPVKEDYQNSSYIFIAVDSADQKTWKMKQGAFRTITQWIGEYRSRSKKTVVLKSTNILGFSNIVREMLDQTPYGKKVDLIVNPEFLREGHAYEDTAKPWRVVIGTKDGKKGSAAEKFLCSIYPVKVPHVVTNFKGAELIKLASNLYLSHRLSFVNEIAEYARQEQLDVDTICRGINLDPRVGQDYFSPGLGFGGSCLPKDCHLINSDELEPSFDFQTAYTALAVNNAVIDGVIDRLRQRLGKLRGRKVALIGVAFKPEADDIRGSQAIKLAAKLRRRGVKLSIFDPLLSGCDIIPETNLPLEKNLAAAIKGAEGIIIGVAHKRFARLSPQALAKALKRRIVVDNFGVLNRKNWENEGFEFL